MLLYSCNKDTLTNCKLSNGKVETEQRTIPEFQNILLRDNVNLIFQKSDENSLSVEAGSNLMSGIVTNVNEKGWLEIRNNNSCDWARDFNTQINIYLNYTNIDSIEYRSIGNISAMDTVQTDTLWIKVMEGAGTIDIDIDVVRLYCELHYGTADILLGGNCGLSFVYSASFGLVDLRNLSTIIAYVANRSSNNVFIKSSNTLEVDISNIGDVYYSGNPPNIKLNRTGSGNLIQLPD